MLIALILILTMVTPVTADDRPWWEREIERLQDERDFWRDQAENQPTTTRPPDNPRLHLLSPQSITVRAGETMEVDITIRNVGTGPAQSVMSQAIPSGPFTIEFLNNSNLTNSIAEGRQHTIRMRITVNDDAVSNNHSIAFTHHFRPQGQNNTTTTDTLPVRIIGAEEDQGEPNVRISNFRVTSASTPISGNQTFTVAADIQNLGQVAARDVQISLPGLSADAIFFTGDLNQAFFPTMAPGHSSTLNFTFQTSSRITGGTHQIDFRVSYRGEPGTTPVVETFPAFVNVYVGEEDTPANLEIHGMTAPTGRIEVGQTATISFYVRNTGDAIARNIRVTASPESTTAIVPVLTSSTQTIQSLAPGESRRLSFSFSPTDSSITRSYAIGFAVSYGGLSFEQFAPLNVYNPNQDGTAGAVQIPRVMISNTVINPSIPRAGQTFDMEITFRNTSANRSVNNIRVLMEEIFTTIPGQGQQAHFAGFNPVDGSNTLFIDYLAPQGEITMNLRFSTVMEATPGAHNMRFTFDYQDQDFATHTANQQISISVAQVTRLELTNVTVGDWGTPTVGSPVRFSYRIINSGRVNLINVRTRTEGETEYSMDTTFGGRYIGQINSQRTADFDGTFTPNEPGLQRGVFIVYGEDTTGEIIEIRHEFEVYVMGGFDMGDWGMGGDWGEGGGRPGFPGIEFPGGNMGMGDAWCPVANEMVTTGYWCMETGEWVSLGEWCWDTGAWLPYSSGFDFIEFIRRPIVWGTAAGVAVVAIIVVVVVLRKKQLKRDLEDDDDDL